MSNAFSIALRLGLTCCFLLASPSGLAAPADDVKAPPPKKGGISVLIATLGSKLIVQRVIAGGPAEKAGVQPMDEIVQIEKDWISGMSTAVAISHLRGEPGSPVQIFIRRQDRPDLLKFIIVREPLPEQPPAAPEP
ncbi:MAG: C-terminal processing protease CtpA/Prc, contains a PDZ domain [Verrucomicrobia bacterium]|jgi:C-terminal processing protease CtpA/Prc|nr:MAG: C-terminal processing protease CtpA/Prc, contains a PDZ domain [Verrucomicrobiota bacterium]